MSRTSPLSGPPIESPASCSTASVLLGKHEVLLRGDGTVWLPASRTLAVADLHLGKDVSFRSAGIAVPAGMTQQTLQLLTKAIEQTDPSHLIILGDLLHNRNSLRGQTIDEVSAWRIRHGNLRCTLTLGNHDPRPERIPGCWTMQTCDHFNQDGIIFRHQSVDDAPASEAVQIAGHLHPAMMLGRGADRLRLPCFLVRSHSITLPAFGPFKGGAIQGPMEGLQFFPIADGQIWSRG